MSKSNVIISILVVVGLAGCATPARIDQMTARNVDPSKISADSPFKNALAVQSVAGGKSTNPLWTSQVGNEEFKLALIQSLKKAHLLAADATQNRYVLDVELVSIDQPHFGLDLKVTATVEYSLKEKATSITLFH